MFIHDKTYDIDELAKYNTHIHTHFSRCAKPEMIVAEIVKAADAAGLEIIAHHHEEEWHCFECR